MWASKTRGTNRDGAPTIPGGERPPATRLTAPLDPNPRSQRALRNSVGGLWRISIPQSLGVRACSDFYAEYGQQTGETEADYRHAQNDVEDD